MKKSTLIFFTVLTLMLTACNASNGPQSSPSSFNNSSDQALPLPTRLLIGSFKLDGTKQEITAKQASDLVPLWQVYKDLSSSDSSAPQEVDALVEQIQETMTPEQVKAITDMKLSRQDMFAVFQQQGIAFQRGQGGNNQNGQTNRSGTPPSGGFPSGGGGNFQSGGGGGFPGGGGGGFPGGNNGQSLSPQQIATARAARAQGNGGFNRLPPALIDALIKYLEKKSAS